MKKLLTILFLAFTSFINAQELSIIPQPDKVVRNEGNFTLNKTTVIIATNKRDELSAKFFNDYLQQYYGFKLKIINTKAPKSNYIVLSTWNDPIFKEALESYQLIVDKNFIAINANYHSGTFYGIQSLIQLLPINDKPGTTKSQIPNPKFQIPAAVIEDGPRFYYRGIHFDVSRHFFPVSFIKQYIDYLALHKFNTFHWHLTDDQGWRIDIKKYPKLTSVGGWRNGTIIGRYPGKGNDSIRYGGFYTHDEIKDVVQYASERFITVIPEIEMPGHASAAIAAYPELSCFPEEDTKIAPGTAWAGPTKGKQVQQAWGVFDDIFCAGNDHTFSFLEDVLEEVMPLFPSKYIHIGGDEAPKTHWKRCNKCQQRMKEQGLKDEHELQSYFIQRIEKYVNSKGKQIIGWDEILEGGLAPNATVMSWQGEKGGIEAAKHGHDVVMTPGNWCYFDHSQSRNEDSVTFGAYTPIEEVYSYDPVPKQLSADESKHILGVQANLWTEYIKNERKVQYQLFPRIAAMSEVAWTAKEKKDSADFEKRLQQQFKRYDMWRVNYSKAINQIHSSINPSVKSGYLAWSLSSKKEKSYIQVNNSNGFGTIYRSPTELEISSTGLYSVSLLSKPEDITFTFDGDSLVITPQGKHDAHFIEMGIEAKYEFNFNKATGKKITTNYPPSPAYPGNGGAFGLVNGIKADKFAHTEWLGWNGKEVEITIDLGKNDLVSEVLLHVWKQEASWIYLPASVDITFNYKDPSGDIQTTGFEFEKPEEGWGEDRQLKFSFAPQRASSVTIKIKPLMKIPEGRQGAGRAAWVFLDEIEIN